MFPRIGERAPVVVTETIRGYEGAVAGDFVPWDGSTPRVDKERALTLRTGTDLRLVLGDLNLPVEIWGLVANPTPGLENDHFEVAFSFVQRAEFERRAT